MTTRWLLPAALVALMITLSLPAITLPAQSKLRPAYSVTLWSLPGFLLGAFCLAAAAVVAAAHWLRRTPLPPRHLAHVTMLTAASGFALLAGMVDLGLRADPISDRDLRVANAPIVACAIAIILVALAVIDLIQLPKDARHSWLDTTLGYAWVPVAVALSVLPYVVRVGGAALPLAEPLVVAATGGQSADSPFEQTSSQLAAPFDAAVGTGWGRPVWLVALVLAVGAAALVWTPIARWAAVPARLAASILMTASAVSLLIATLVALLGRSRVGDQITAAGGGQAKVTASAALWLILLGALALLGAAIVAVVLALRTPWAPLAAPRLVRGRARRRPAPPAPGRQHPPGRPAYVVPAPPVGAANGRPTAPPMFGERASTATGVFRAFPTPVTAPPR